MGESRNFDEGLVVHDKEECAKRNGATHVHAHFSSPDEHVRKAEKAYLLAKLKPVCNA